MDKIKFFLAGRSNKYIKKLQKKLYFWQKGLEFRGHPYFDLKLVDEGFLDQPYDGPDDTYRLRRIITAYKKAKLVQHSVPPSFQVSNEWLPIYEQPLRGVMHALKNENIEDLRRIYQNFMRDSCSTGLVGLGLDMQKHFFGKKISRKNKKLFLYDTLHRYYLWKSLLVSADDTRALTSPSIGNPFGYFIDGVFIKAGSDYLHYYATTIGRLIKNNDRPVVVELGGGYGGMAYYLARDNVNVTYVDFDLPENMALTAYYLLTAFPDKRIVLFGETDFTSDCLANNDIIILPSFEITKLPEKCADLVFNSYSLAEMSPETIQTFISEFHRIVKTYLLHVNHTKKAVVSADNFGINPSAFDLIYKIPALWNGGRSFDMDEYEYLYKRVAPR